MEKEENLNNVHSDNDALLNDNKSSANESSFNLLDLSGEIHEAIFIFLDAKDLLQLIFVCKQFTWIQYWNNGSYYWGKKISRLLDLAKSFATETKIDIDHLKQNISSYSQHNWKEISSIVKEAFSKCDDYDGMGLVIVTVLNNRINLEQEKFIPMLIEQGVDIDKFNRRGTTFLYVAIQFDRLDIVKLLIKYGANPNKLNKNQDTPLNLATILSNANYLDEKILTILNTANELKKNTLTNSYDSITRQLGGKIYFPNNNNKEDIPSGNNFTCSPLFNEKEETHDDFKQPLNSNLSNTNNS